MLQNYNIFFNCANFFTVFVFENDRCSIPAGLFGTVFVLFLQGKIMVGTGHSRGILGAYRDILGATLRRGRPCPNGILAVLLTSKIIFMARILNVTPVDLFSGKIARNSDGTLMVGRVINGVQYMYRYNPEHQPFQTEAMKQTRTALHDAQAKAIAIEQDPEQRAYWEQLYAKARAHHRRHPDAYAQFRREELRSQNRRVRSSSLVFPSDLRHYIISSLMRRSDPWT